MSETFKYFIYRVGYASIWPVETAGCRCGKPGKQEAI
jgi:hypothetical protein